MVPPKNSIPSRTPRRCQVYDFSFQNSLFDFRFEDHTLWEFNDAKTNSLSLNSLDSYFADVAAFLSRVWKLSSSSQNCSAKVHFGLNPNSMCVVQRLV